MSTISAKSKKRRAISTEDATNEDMGTPAKVRKKMNSNPDETPPPIDVDENTPKGRFAIKKLLVFTRPKESPNQQDDEGKNSVPPPFVVPANCNNANGHNSLSDHLKATLKASLAQGDFTIKNQSLGVTIRVTDHNAYIKAETALLKEKIKFFSYPKANEGIKMQKFVIYDLGDVDTAEIIDDLKEYGLEPLDVRKMTIKTPRYPGQANYIVYFDADDRVSLSMVSMAKHICYTIVKWAHFKEPIIRIRQCSNCYKFGHSDGKCHLPTVCLFCAKHHKAADCPLLQKKLATGANSIPSYLLKCTNCNKEHTAIYQHCATRIDYTNKQRPPHTGEPTAATTRTRNPHLMNTTTTTNQRTNTQTPAHRPQPVMNWRAVVQRSHSPPRKATPRIRKSRSTTPPPGQSTKSTLDQPATINNQSFNIRPTRPIKPQMNENRSITSNNKDNTNNQAIRAIEANNSNSDIFTSQELLRIFQEMTGTISSCKNKQEQLEALMSLALKYMPCRA